MAIWRGSWGQAAEQERQAGVSGRTGPGESSTGRTERQGANIWQARLVMRLPWWWPLRGVWPVRVWYNRITRRVALEMQESIHREMAKLSPAREPVAYIGGRWMTQADIRAILNEQGEGQART